MTKMTYDEMATQLAAVVAERDALAAESAALKLAIADITFMDDEAFFNCDQRAQEVMGRIVNIETPATDAVVAAIEARAIKSALDSCVEYYETDCVMDRLGISYDDAELRTNGALELYEAMRAYAAELREGK